MNKTDKPLARLINKKGRIQIEKKKIRNEKGEVTTDATEIQRTVNQYYEQLYANKLDHLEEMEEFPETYHVWILNQEETENPNKTISNEVEAVIKNLPTNKSSGVDGFTGEV